MTYRTTAPRFALSAIAASLLAISAPTLAASDIVISQVYGGGGNSGATLKNDFIELFNRGASAVSLGGWSLQYASSTGSTWNNMTALPNVVLQPGQFFLIQEAAGTGGTTALPTPDASGSIAMSGTAGKVALVASTTALTGATPTGYIDLVGYGTANHFEGAGAAPGLSNTTAAIRTVACTDTDNNSADFTATTPNPRNSATPLAACGGTPINAAIVPSCPSLTVDQGSAGSATITATDSDSVVNNIVASGILPSGFTLSNLVTASGDGGTASIQLNVAAGVSNGNYNVGLSFSNDEAQSATCNVAVTVQAAAGITRIFDIQGSGSASPLVGNTVTTEGIVSAVFPNLSGYYLQDATGDNNVETSDGIFVYAPGASVSVGQKLRLTASVAEYNSVTELTGPTNLQVIGNGTITPTDISLPEAVEGDLERYEGMLVRIVTPLTASQNYFQGRYGQVTLSAGGRLEIPTNRYPAGSADALAMADENARRRIVLDDGSSAQNPNPIPFIGADNTLRAGDTVTNLTGVIDHGLITASNPGPRDYKLHPTVTPVFTRDNPRTAAPASIGGNVKVASFNVLNYFTTFTNGQTASGQTGQGCTLGASTSASNCRGADSAAEFARQQAKIVAALKAINADVVGLMEIQNNGTVAVQNLVNALNTAYGTNVYAAVTNLNGSTGTDAIRVAMIYKPSTVNPENAAISDSDPIHNRPPLAQTFRTANGEKFSVIVNHFKSKSCSDASGLDADLGDGQGCYNDRRKQQAAALLTFMDNIKATSGDNDVLVIGDLNSYGREDPIRVLTDGGLNNLLSSHLANPYSYTFDGESGYLDHALASTTLTGQTAGITEWHINTDEPSVIDYNTEFKPQDLYSATPYRSSDHDPVIVGLNLLKRIDGTSGRDSIVGTSGDDVITGGVGADTLTGGAGADQFVFTSLRDGVDTITDFQPGVDRIVLTQVLQSLGIPAGSPIASGYVTCSMSGANALIGIDTDALGVASSRPLVLLKNQTCAVAVPGNFVF